MSVTPSPYKGLTHYTEEDAAFFFGRDTEREIIVANLMASRLTLLYGESGVGKSSVLHAGVVRSLREEASTSLADRGEAEFLPVVFSDWRDDPLQGLQQTLADAAARLYDGKLEPPPAGGGLSEHLAAWTARIDGDVLLVLDQFEEYFLYHPGDEGPGSFAVEFPRALNRGDLRASFLIGIREDGLAKLDAFKGRIPNLFDNYLRIEHLSPAAARQAIERPLAEYNRRTGADNERVEIEPALVEGILEQLSAGQFLFAQAGGGTVEGESRLGVIETPFLQLVMTRLWNEELREGSRVLRLETLERLGGAERIVRTHLDTAITTLSRDEQDLASDVFHHLVTPSGTKIAHAAADLAEYVRRPEGEVVPVLEKLSGANLRILRPVAPPPDQPAGLRYEIFHDVLAAAILDWRRRFERAQTEEELVEAQARARLERRRARIFRGLAIALAVCVLGALAAVAVLAVRESHRAGRQSRLAASRALAGEALSASGGRVDLAGLLSIEAYRARPSFEARSAMLAGVQRNPSLLGFLRGHTDSVQEVALTGDLLASASGDKSIKLWSLSTHQPRATLTGHSETVRSVDLRPDARVLASGSADQTVMLWDLNRRRQIGSALRGHGATVTTVSFSPDGKTLATGSLGRTVAGERLDGTIILWDVARPDEPRRLATMDVRTDAVESLAWTPDGRTLASGSLTRSLANDKEDNTDDVVLWDVSNLERPQKITSLSGHKDSVLAVDFSPDGDLLASAGVEGDVFLWRVKERTRVRTLEGHDDSIETLAFNPAGKTLATGSVDSKVFVWDVASGKRLLSFEEHPQTVFTVAFTPDGKTLAAGANDNAIVLWDVGTPRVLAEHESDVKTVAFSPDGRTLASGSKDKTILLWDVSSRRPIGSPLGGHEDTVTSVAFSPDGKQLASGSADQDVILWDLSDRSAVRKLTGHTDTVYAVEFSPDGKVLASGSFDDTVILWDVGSGEKLATLEGHDDQVYTVAFTRDGRRLASGGRDSLIIIWDVVDPKHPRELSRLEGHTDSVNFATFTRDGSRLASGSFDRTIFLWDVATKKPTVELLGHQNAVQSVAFTPDERILASGSNDNTVMLWDLEERRGLGLPLRAHTDVVRSVAISSDGRTLASGSDDGTVQLWDRSLWSGDIAGLERRLCRIVGRNLTAIEWDQFLPGKDYRKTCPQWPPGRVEPAKGSSQN